MNILETVSDTITDAKDSVVYYFTGETYTTRKKLFTTCTLCMLTGIILGFVLSPIKKGIYFNISNNGNYAPDEEINECNKRNTKRCKNH